MWIDKRKFEELIDIVSPNVCLTFDDGFDSCWDVALPILEEKGMTAKFFVTVWHIGRKGYLTDEQLRDMRRAGMEIGTHGMFHRSWQGLGPRGLQEEIFEAKDQLEQILGTVVTEAACPFGAYDRRCLDALRRAGMRRVFTSDRLPANLNRWLIPRYTIRASDAEDDWKRIINYQEPVLPWLRRAKIALKRWR